MRQYRYAQLFFFDQYNCTEPTYITAFIPGRARIPLVNSAVAVEGVHHKPEPEPEPHCSAFSL